jgi:hypothetical protein
MKAGRQEFLYRVMAPVSEDSDIQYTEVGVYGVLKELYDINLKFMGAAASVPPLRNTLNNGFINFNV